MNTKNKFLVVVDMQNDFCHNDNVLGNEYAKAIVSNVKDLVTNFVNEDLPVLFTVDSHTKEGYNKCREGKYLPIPHCFVGSDGQKIIPELSWALQHPKCICLYKLDSFGFYNLNQVMKDVDYQINYPFDVDKEYEIHICGVVTNMCVLSVALNFQNLFRKSEIIIHSNACASNDPEMHQKALDIMRGLQMQVI